MRILKELGLAKYFRAVYGGNSFETKNPTRSARGRILREFGAAPAEAILVGDSEVDVQTARNAGTRPPTVNLASARTTAPPSRRTFMLTGSRISSPSSGMAANEQTFVAFVVLCHRAAQSRRCLADSFILDLTRPLGIEVVRLSPAVSFMHSAGVPVPVGKNHIRWIEA